MRTGGAALVAALFVAAPTVTNAWGIEPHRQITKRAIAGLPVGLKAFFATRAAFVIEHSIDPDQWRIVGLKGDRGDEDPNHFLDIDGLDEPHPFKGVPRDWDAYVTRYGAERANKMGRLPWRAEEIYKLLVQRFQDVARNPQGYAADNVAYLSAALAHYVEDAHQPFHAALNYDGQLTNQRGIHARFETDLVMRNLATLKLTPVTIRPVPNIKEFIFDALASGQAMVQSVLDADKAATEGREFYDEVYFAKLLKGSRPVLERRLSDAASGVASAITAAWTEAGKPAMPVTKTTAPVRIRR